MLEQQLTTFTAINIDIQIVVQLVVDITTHINRAEWLVTTNYYNMYYTEHIHKMIKLLEINHTHSKLIRDKQREHIE